MEIYLARMYSHMPFEDFKYMAQWGYEYNGWLSAMGIEGTGEAVNRDGICAAFTGERTAYWGDAFKLLRDANYLARNAAQIPGSFGEVTYNHYLGEAYYVRATVFYAMARRFGGVPLVTHVIDYPGFGQRTRSSPCLRGGDVEPGAFGLRQRHCAADAQTRSL